MIPETVDSEANSELSIDQKVQQPNLVFLIGEAYDRFGIEFDDPMWSGKFQTAGQLADIVCRRLQQDGVDVVDEPGMARDRRRVLVAALQGFFAEEKNVNKESETDITLVFEGIPVLHRRKVWERVEDQFSELTFPELIVARNTLGIFVAISLLLFGVGVLAGWHSGVIALLVAAVVTAAIAADLFLRWELPEGQQTYYSLADRLSRRRIDRFQKVSKQEIWDGVRESVESAFQIQFCHVKPETRLLNPKK